MTPHTEINNLLVNLYADLQDIRVLWQVGVLALCLLIAWLLSRQLRTRFASEVAHAETKLKFGVEGLGRVLLPLIGVALVLIGRAILKRYQTVHLLNVAVPLLTSWVMVQTVVYMLRHVFAPGGVLRTWERTIAWTVWAGLALHITGLLPELRMLLDAYSFKVGEQRISMLLVLQGLLSVALTLLLALWVARLIENRLTRATTLDPNLRIVLAKLSKIVLVLVAVLITLPAVGIDLTVLSVFSGALGVGIGFGLQKIAANYISGFIILLDRSVSPGALVTVDGQYGELTKLAPRYVVVKGMDGTEAIIPNETLITSKVINHAYSDPRVLMEIPVQVSYDSDVERALELLVQCAKAHLRVVSEPAPTAVLKSFGDSGIDLALLVWISDPEKGRGNLSSDLNRAIWATFRQNGVEIPYPRREVRILNDTPPEASNTLQAPGAQ